MNGLHETQMCPQVVIKEVEQTKDKITEIGRNYLSDSRLKCHGTTFSALYLMSRLSGENQNSLVSYGELDKLKIPVFSGECFRGISDNGVNRENVSWYYVKDIAASHSYAMKFPFSLEETKAYLKEIISDNEKYLKRLGSEIEADVHIFQRSRPPFGLNYHTAYWNKIILRIRQLRAWDEPLFQQEFKEGLIAWLNEEMAFLKRPQFKDPEQQPIYHRMMDMKDEINAPAAFQLNEEDKTSILKTYPIIFFTAVIPNYCNGEDELGISKKLKLGEDIQMIATSTEHMKEVAAHLRLQGLVKKVSLISFAAFGLEG